jgi:hypothetical protein
VTGYPIYFLTPLTPGTAPFFHLSGLQFRIFQMTATNKRRFTKDGTSFPELNKRSEISIIHSERSPNFTHQKIYDTPVEREHIEEKLASGTFVIVLQTVPSRNSHCRAWNCLPRELSGRPNICSDFRFNLRDLSGRRYGKLVVGRDIRSTTNKKRTRIQSLLSHYLHGANSRRPGSVGV